MAITQNYVDPVGGSDLNAGTLAAPWQTLQHAFDTCVRNTVDGNQINLKASGAHTNAAALNLTTFVAGGALSATAPLVLRGYTAAANDGGIGEIDCGGNTMWAATTYDYVTLQNLETHSFGNNHGIVLRYGFRIVDCEIHRGSSTPTNKILVYSNQGSLIGSYVHDAGELPTSSGFGIYPNSAGIVECIGNYFRNCLSSIYVSHNWIMLGNIIYANAANALGIICNGNNLLCLGNIVYNAQAGTGTGITAPFASRVEGDFLNNIVVGFGGVGGIGMSVAGKAARVGHNAFYGNTVNVQVSGEIYDDLRSHDVALAADPFTNAASGDFSLTAAAKALLRDVGWPEAYLGAHANTDGHITIGPIQYGEAPTGYPAVGDVRLGIVYGENNEYTGTFAGGGARGRILYGMP